MFKNKSCPEFRLKIKSSSAFLHNFPIRIVSLYSQKKLYSMTETPWQNLFFFWKRAIESNEKRKIIKKTCLK